MYTMSVRVYTFIHLYCICSYIQIMCEYIYTHIHAHICIYILIYIHVFVLHVFTRATAKAPVVQAERVCLYMGVLCDAYVILLESSRSQGQYPRPQVQACLAVRFREACSFPNCREYSSRELHTELARCIKKLGCRLGT